MADPTGTNSAQNSALECILGLKGQTLSPGMYTDVEVPWNCFVSRWTMLGDQVGSSVVDILTCTESQFDAGATHPVPGDSITAGSPPTISGISACWDSIMSTSTEPENTGPRMT